MADIEVVELKMPAAVAFSSLLSVTARRAPP